MMIEEIKRLYEDLKIRIKTNKEIKEGNVQKYDDILLKRMIDFDYYNIPMIYSLFNPGFKKIGLKDISLGLARFLKEKGSVSLVRSRSNDYYLLELKVGDKTYIYDVLTKLVYNKDTYYEINSDIPYVKLVTSEELDKILENDMYLMRKAEETEARKALIESSINDYQNGNESSFRTNEALNTYVREVVTLELTKLNDFSRYQ